MTVKTFSELESAQDVDAADLRDTLRDYASSGAAISAPVVLGLLARAGLDAEDIAHLAESGQIGRASQARRGHGADAAAYDEVNAALDALSTGPRPAGA